MCSYREVKWGLLGLCIVAACGDRGGFPDAPESPPKDPGSFRLSWILTTSSQQVLTCAQASATTVRVSIVDTVSSERASASFDCPLGIAVSGALFPSTYDLSFELLGAAGTITTAPPQTTMVLPNQTTQLGLVVFLVP